MLDINHLLVISIANIFSHSVGYFLISSMVFFAVQKFLSLIISHLFIFAFISFTLGKEPQKTLLYVRSALPVFGLTFRSLIYFEFIFVYGIRECCNLIFLHLIVQFSQHHLLKRLSFLPYIFLPPLSQINRP